MMSEKGFLFVSAILSCMVAPLILSCLAGPSIAAGEQTEAKFYEEIKKALEATPLCFVAYGKKKGQPIAVIAAPNATVLMETETGDLSADFTTVLRRIEARDERDKIVDTISETTFFVHSSPGCIIRKLPSGGYKVICN